ncbi:MAG: ABC transporter substrate-binding protein [Ruminococcaceae bacterium]|nr:ABC transporter substrate-binding protein [Oscillospiraceae bacterium]
MNARKIVALLLAVLLFCMTGCKNDPGSAQNGTNSENATANTVITLLYCSNDTFNPYTVKTKINFELCQLLFDPLISLDNNFSPIYKLAQSAVQNGNTWTVTIKNAVFSDNSSIKGDDVVYSFNLAKNHSNFRSALKDVKSVTADGNTVTFTLNINDPYFINLLNFPIIKSGSDNIRNEDSVLLTPIGAGRYILDENQTSLIKNDKYYDKLPKYNSIALLNAPNSESVSHYASVGATDFYYSNATEGQIFRMDGKKFSINQNRLCYLGINMSNPILSNVKVRYAISAALNRSNIASTAFYGNAVAANGPFSPFFKETESYQTIESSDNNKIAIENLEQIGYNIIDNGGTRKNIHGTPLSFSLLINKENSSHALAAELIKAQLSNVGIKINITALNYNDYVAALNKKSFVLYLAEVKLNNNFDISPLVVAGGSCAYGIADDESNKSLTDIVNKYKSGQAVITDVITSVGSQMPIIPICYCSGMIFYSEKIDRLNNASADDLYMFIQN